jgi:hypothetical protein
VQQIIDAYDRDTARREEEAVAKEAEIPAE